MKATRATADLKHRGVLEENSKQKTGEFTKQIYLVYYL